MSSAAEIDRIEYRDAMHKKYGGEPGNSLAWDCSHTWRQMTDAEVLEYRQRERVADAS